MMKKGAIKAQLLIKNYHDDDDTIYFDYLKKKESMHESKPDKGEKENQDEND